MRPRAWKLSSRLPLQDDQELQEVPVLFDGLLVRVVEMLEEKELVNCGETARKQELRGNQRVRVEKRGCDG